MLGDKSAAATVAVKDMAAARNFYEQTLGLKKTDYDDPDGVMYQSGNSGVFVYSSDFAGTNKATAITWRVGEEIETIAQDLKKKGVVFEHYDMEGITRQGDIHIMGDLKSAWFKDPSGNILNIVNQ